jgi:putative DNA primase/helicase
MNSETVMRSLASLNQLWDGAEIATDRRGSESFVLRGARLTIALQIQEITLKSFLERTGSLARGSGFLARFLIAWPVSKIGQRPFHESTGWDFRDAFQQRLRELLELPVAIDENGGLTPRMLSLSPEAKTIWIAFHNRIEEQMRPSGSYAEIKDVAAKSADNAARLAALFHAFGEKDDDYICGDDLKAACQIVEWHLCESRRFFSQMVLPPKLTDAKRLEEWLVDRMRTTGQDRIPTCEVQQFGPNDLRPKAKFEPIAQELAQLSRLRFINEGKRKFVTVNPVILERGR